MAVVANPPAEPATGAAGLGKRLVTFYQGVMVELRKVTWPDVPQVRQATIAIIIFVVILAAVISLLDVVLKGVLVKFIPSLFAGRGA